MPVREDLENETATDSVAALVDGLTTTMEIKGMAENAHYPQEVGPAKRGKVISEAEFRRLWNNPWLSMCAIARILGISDKAVSSRAKTRGLPPRSYDMRAQHRLPEDEFRKLWLAGVRTRDIVVHYGCHHLTPANTAKRLGLAARGRGFAHYGISMEDYCAQILSRKMAAEAARRQARIIADGRADFIVAENGHAAPRPVGSDFAREACK